VVGLLLGLLAATPASAQIIYVDVNANGANDGSSWADAYTSLQTALGAAAIGDTLWVAEGTYYPDEGSGVSADDPVESFTFPDSVAMYGGFSGSESSLSERDVTANRTILSGDIQQDDTDPDGDGLIQVGDISGSNSYHVVEGAASGGRLDGVYVTAGDASGSTVPNNRGGGLYVPPQVGSTPAMTVVRTRFVGNRAITSGGGISVDDANVVLSNIEFIGNGAANDAGGGLHVTATDFGQVWMANVVFTGNSAGTSGGAIANPDGSATLYNVTMAQNEAVDSGGGLYTTAATTVYNTIFWGNTAGLGPEIYTDATLSLNTSVLEGDTSTIAGTGSVTSSYVQDADPLFVDSTGADGTAGTPDDELRTNWASPGIDPLPQQSEVVSVDSADVDNDGNATEPLPVDLMGQPRFLGRSVDVGAYEGGLRPQGTSVVYADAADGINAGQSGGSWNSPYRTLQAALTAARNADAAGALPFEEVWVAEGTYYPTPQLASNGDTVATFALVDSVAVYGGFQNGDSFSQRDPNPATNGTVLSGDIGVQNDTSDNSNAVVSGGLRFLDSLSQATTLDGFTITQGTATEGGNLNRQSGGGIWLGGGNEQSVSPTLRNLRITQNYAESGAGLVVFSGPGSIVRPRISEVDLIGNVAASFSGGMLLSSSGGTLAPHLANVRILGNEAKEGAALGIGAENSGTTSPTFSNLLVSGNVSAADSTTAIFRNATDGTLEPSLLNATWANNTASTDSLSALVETRLFSEAGPTTLRIANNILWGNANRSLVSGPADPVRIDSSVIEGGWSGSGSSVIDADPRYVNPTGPDGVAGTTDDSLQVMTGSPALDHGGTSLLPSDATDLDGDGDQSEQLPLDLRGEARIQGASVDAGAFEGASSLPNVTLSHPDDLPAPGTATPVTITIPSTFNPTTGTFYYRPAGASSFERISLDLAGVDQRTVEIPGSAVTEHGTQYFLRISGYRSGSEEEMAFPVPATAPTETAFLPVQVPELSAAGTFASERYRMLTVPAALGDRSVFDALEDQYGSYDPSAWRLARWAPTDSTYRLGPEVDSLRPGEAAWLITATGDSLTLNDVRAADASGPVSISLQPGWNQIGSPFAFPVAWASVRRPESVRMPVAYDASRPRGERYRFEASTLQPWQGAFVYNTAETTVSIQVPPVAATNTTASSSAQKTLASASEAGYRLQAIATASHDDRRLQDRTTWLGFAEGAKAGFGPKDLAKPPAVGPHVRVQASTDDGPALARSLKPPSANGAAWDLTVGLHLDAPLRSETTVTVQLAEQGRRPEGFERYVIDRDRNQRLPVTDQSVTLTLTPEQPTRRLQVIVGTESFAKQKSEGVSLSIDETTLRTNAPNPFTEATTISYQLADRQEVTIAIYDLLGRRVETLVDGPQEPGVHRTTWRATDSNGQTLASGVYFCRMKAGSYTGTQKLVLVR
jgi:hypothetical protein